MYLLDDLQRLVGGTVRHEGQSQRAQPCRLGDSAIELRTGLHRRRTLPKHAEDPIVQRCGQLSVLRRRRIEVAYPPRKRIIRRLVDSLDQSQGRVSIASTIDGRTDHYSTLKRRLTSYCRAPNRSVTHVFAIPSSSRVYWAEWSCAGAGNSTSHGNRAVVTSASSDASHANATKRDFSV